MRRSAWLLMRCSSSALACGASTGGGTFGGMAAVRGGGTGAAGAAGGGVGDCGSRAVGGGVTGLADPGAGSREDGAGREAVAGSSSTVAARGDGIAGAGRNRSLTLAQPPRATARIGSQN